MSLHIVSGGTGMKVRTLVRTVINTGYYKKFFILVFTSHTGQSGELSTGIFIYLFFRYSIYPV